MAKGLPKSIIKKYGITKKAWSIYRGRGHKRTSSPKKRGGQMVRRRRIRYRYGPRRRGGGGKSITRTIFKFLRIGALVAPGVATVMQPISDREKLDWIISYYTGYDMRDGKWRPERLAVGWGPFVAATLVTMGVQKLSGIIRRI